ncbi:MAG: serine hydrolase domain-containing protein [Candidatus Thorarchaeota archaeon]
MSKVNKVQRRRIILTVTSVWLVLMLSNVMIQFPDATGTEIVSPSIDSEIERLTDEGNIPSCHVCVVSGNENNWVRGYGQETDPDTVFLIGSTQKVFVAVSVLQLHDEGLIDIDDDVNDYLPFEIRHPDYPDAEITIRMLLSHRAGLALIQESEFCYDWAGAYYPDYGSYYYPSVIGITLGDFLRECFSPEGQFYSTNNWEYEPGTQHLYANSGFKILMYLLEVVSNQTIEEYMKENIFTPLRLNNTGFYASDFEGLHAVPHARSNGVNVPLPVWNGEYMLRSTVADMGHFLIALMNEGEFDGNVLLEPETVEMMLTNAANNATTLDLVRALKWKGYGLGMTLYSHGLYGHGGSTIGFTCEWFFNPESKLGFVRLSSVGGVLMRQDGDWEALESYTDAIRDLVFTDIGLFPQISILEISLLVGITIVSFNVLRLGLKRYNRLQTKTAQEIALL